MSAKFPALIVTRMTKGGVGKTSICVNLACTLAMMGYRVLVIDADPQASASNLLGIETARYDTRIQHIGHFLTRPNKEADNDLSEAIEHIYADGFLDLIPSDITLAESDASLVTVMASHARAHLFLSRNAAFLSRHYDVIFVDTAPGTTPIGLAFSYAAKEAGKVLTVVEPEGSCLRALDSLASNLAEINTVTGAEVGMEVVVNKYHPSLKHVRESMGFLYSKYGNMLNDSIVPQFSGFARQLNPGNRDAAPLVEVEPSSVGAAAIIDVAKSLIQSFGIQQPGLPTGR
jgi:chromosome partitioning protein